MDIAGPYLREQLIAYIGNKRALLPFLREVFSGLPLEPSRCAFLDPFAGSGAVSRLARVMGFRVTANDWEPYSFLINTCHVRLNPSDLPVLFPARGGIAAVLDELNSLPPPREDEEYISRHYAPRNTLRGDWHTERLFYTRENALAIDAMRQRIEEMFPGTPVEETARLGKAALLAPLLYQAATHTNTSGVFKAFHKGFGGHGGDALQRIMGPILLASPVLVDSPAPAEVTCMDAGDFLSGRTAEVCYLDPPYAVHQYGSNYFMLNTIALWDRPPVNDERRPDGSFLHKAGIRPDWTRTRSAFCSRDTAPTEMGRILRAADCRWLVASYSNEGLIGLEELCDILAETGSLSLRSREYAKYPGGKQGLHRTSRNMETLLVVHRGPKTRVPPSAREALRHVRLARLLGLSYNPSLILQRFPVRGEAIVAGEGNEVLFPMRHFWRFAPGIPLPHFPDGSSAEAFNDALSGCAVRDVREEIDVVVSLAGNIHLSRERNRILRESLRLLNKLAHRKYRTEFAEALGVLRAAAPRFGAGPGFVAGLDMISRKADRRMAAGPMPQP